MPDLLNPFCGNGRQIVDEEARCGVEKPMPQLAPRRATIPCIFNTLAINSTPDTGGLYQESHFFGTTALTCFIFRPSFWIPIAWYKARIPGLPRYSIREGANNYFEKGPVL